MNPLPLPNVRCWLGLLVVCSGLILAACPKNRPPNQADYETAVAQRTEMGIYKPPIAQAQQAGLAVYWLGVPYRNGDVLLDVLEAQYPSRVEGVRFNGVTLHYAASDHTSDLQLSTIPRTEWPAVAEKVLNPGVNSGASKRSISVAGHQAELVSVPLYTNRVGLLWLAIDMGDFFVLCETTSVEAAGRTEVNPLIDPDRLVALMEQIRPYPQ